MPRVKLSRIFGSGASIGPGKATLLEGIRNSGSISARRAAAIARETAFGIREPTLLPTTTKSPRRRSVAALPPLIQ